MKRFVILTLALLLTTALYATEYGGGNGIDQTPPRIEDVNYKMQRTYPGILHNMEDIKNMRKVVKKADKKSEAYKTYKNLKSMTFAQADYAPRILDPKFCNGAANTISRFNSPDWINKWEYDFYAMALNAVMFAITEKQEHADKVAQMLNLYADRVISTSTGESTPLAVGINMINFIYAADMIQSLAPQTFKEGEYAKICKWLVDVGVCPETENVFFKTPAYTNGNWGAVVLMSYMALAVLLEDDERYERAIDQYLYSSTFRDNGTLLHYLDDEGQCQETGRDAAHAQLGIYGLNMVAEMAWKCGTDLYSAYDNRMLKGYEYLAKFNMGYDDVPYKVWQDMTVKSKYSRWQTISQSNRGDWRDIYEMPYNHYVYRMGLEMPYTKELLNMVSPMKYPDPDRRTAAPTKTHPDKSIRQDDHFAFGAFLFMNDAK
ncbi:MAG: alginate lyase family protein [Rikenellaceae bacterium]